MKTKDFIKLVQEADPSGECNVCIPLAFGMGGPRVNVTGVHVGFDWYMDQLCLQTDLDVVGKTKYMLQGDQLANAKRLCYIRILPNETAKYYEGRMDTYVGPRKPNYKPGDVIKVRQCGQKDFIKVKILKQLAPTVLLFPEFQAVLA